MSYISHFREFHLTDQRFFEDIEVGETWVSARVTLTEEDIVGFAREYDPQPIHCDPATAGEGRFGSVIASGWHLTALTMKLFVESGGYGATPMIGLGIDELRWRQVVRPGDVLQVERKVIETRQSASNPRFGIVRTLITVTNAKSEPVMTMISVGQVLVRQSAA